MSRVVASILVVEDDNAFRKILVNAFRDRGYEAEGVADAAAAIAAAERDSPEMAVIDLRLPDDSGLEVVRRLKAIDPSTAIVVLTGYGSIATALAGAGRVGVPESRAHRLRRKHFRSRAPTRDASPFASAETLEIPGLAVSRTRGLPNAVRAQENGRGKRFSNVLPAVEGKW